MTRHKGFKRLVRDRMARTGERYAAARRAIEGTSGRAAPAVASPAGGTDPETAALATLLRMRGASNGLTGRPFTDDEILGIGGGLGAGYILWEFHAHGQPFLTLGFRNRWQYPVPWLESALGRIGTEAELFETGGARGATARLDELVGAGEPVIAWVDPQALGTWGLPPEMSGYVGSVAVVTGRQDGRYIVDDRGAVFEIDAETMAAARGRIVSYKHRLARVPALGEVPAATVKSAYLAGLADQVEHLRSSSESFGLPAWRKWSRLLVDRRNAKAWPRVFEGRVGLFSALLSVVEGVDGEVGPSGGHLRERYAAFLETAAAALDRPSLGDAAIAWRLAADLWEDLADAAVPAELAGAAEAVDAAEELHAAAMAGDAGRARASSAAGTLWATRERYARAFPLPDAAVDRLFSELSERLAAIHAAEVAAVDATAAAIDGARA